MKTVLITGCSSGYLRELGNEITTSIPYLDLCFELMDLTIKFLEVVKQSLDKHAKGPRQLVVNIFNQLRDQRGDVADALKNDESENSPRRPRI